LAADLRVSLRALAAVTPDANNWWNIRQKLMIRGSADVHFDETNKLCLPPVVRPQLYDPAPCKSRLRNDLHCVEWDIKP